MEYQSDKYERKAPEPQATPEQSGPIVAQPQAAPPAVSIAQREAQLVLSVNLADPASRARARLVIDILQGGGAVATKSRLLSKRILTLARADSGTSRIIADLEALARKVKSLGLPRATPSRRSFMGKLFGSVEKRESLEEGLARLKASRTEIEHIISSLTASAEVLRQNEVALGRYEIDIRTETRRISDDIAMAEEFEPALVAAIDAARRDNAEAASIRFAEREVLLPLEQQRQQLQTLLAVNQQAALSLSLLKETNQTLINHVRDITWATRHAMDTAMLLDRTLEERRIKELQTQTNTWGDPTHAQTVKSLSGMSELQTSLDELYTALEYHDVWQQKATAKTTKALGELQSLSAQVFEGTDPRVPC